MTITLLLNVDIIIFNGLDRERQRLLVASFTPSALLRCGLHAVDRCIKLILWSLSSSEDRAGKSLERNLKSDAVHVVKHRKVFVVLETASNM